jgi:putative DNA helicase
MTAPLNPKVAMADASLDAFGTLPAHQKKALRAFLSKFRANPRSSAINYELIHGAAHPGMRSVRITQEIRAIVLKPDKGDVYTLLWVGQHDEAYQWASRHKVSVHPDVGSIQIYAVRHVEAPATDGEAMGMRTPPAQAHAPGQFSPPASASVVGQDIPTVPAHGVDQATLPVSAPVVGQAGQPASPPAALAPAATAVSALFPKRYFRDMSDLEIRRLGIPEDYISAVRAIRSDEDLEALESQLPREGFEAIFMVAAGEPLEAVYESLYGAGAGLPAFDTEDFGAALERDSTRRHFVVMTDDTDLEALLTASLERWRVFLHPAQRRLVERSWSGPVKVNGGPGTGKTVAAMHRARWLARQYRDLPGKPVLFTTFTKTLAEDIRQNLAALCTPAELDRIEVVHIDSWAFGLLKRFDNYAYRPLYRLRDRDECWALAWRVWSASASQDLRDNPLLSPRFMRAEFERVVMAQGCTTADEYMRARRVGRGGQLGRAQRKGIWPIFAEYRNQLRSRGLIEPEDAFRDARQLLERQPQPLGIRAMVVDEAQDISPAAWALIRAAVPQDENDLFIVGDPNQRIYRHKVTLSAVGIHARGRSRTLKINYRTTDEIRRWAVAQLEGRPTDDLDGGSDDSLKGYQSLTHGEKPEVIPSASVQEDVQHIQAIIGSQLARRVCVVSRTNRLLDELSGELGCHGIEHLRLDADTPDDADVPGIRLATMHRVKGLEFDVVIVAGYKGASAYAAAFSREEDAGVTEDFEQAERCLLLVAATRAKRYLAVLQRS